MTIQLSNLVIVGFNGYVVALHIDTGDIVWEWKASHYSGGYVSLLLVDKDHLIASVDGYTYCLHPVTGEQLWFNKLSGYGTGVVSIVALDRHNPHHLISSAAAATASATTSTMTTAGRTGSV